MLIRKTWLEKKNLNNQNYQTTNWKFAHNGRCISHFLLYFLSLLTLRNKLIKSQQYAGKIV